MEQVKSKQIQQMKKEIEENKASNAPMVPAYNHFKEETEELNRIFADAYNFSFQYSEPKVDGMQIRRAINLSFTAESFDKAVSMIHEVLEGPYRCLIEDLSIEDDEDETEEMDIPEFKQNHYRGFRQLGCPYASYKYGPFKFKSTYRLLGTCGETALHKSRVQGYDL